jgi:hypothetical protein
MPIEQVKRQVKKFVKGLFTNAGNMRQTPPGLHESGWLFLRMLGGGGQSSR